MGRVVALKRTQSVHHRKPTSIGGANETRNLSLVPARLHEAWHTLFANYEAEEICRLINEYWLDPDYELHCHRRK